MKKRVIFIAIVILLAACGKERPAQLGKKFIEIGDYENAIVVFEKAVLQYPQDADLRFEMGKAYARIDEEREARQQFQFAARIGSKAISDSFLTWGKDEDIDWGSSYFLFNLALTANPKNIDAVFEKARYEVRYERQHWHEKQKSLLDMAHALKKRSDDYTVNAAFEALKNNKDLLFNAYARQVTKANVEDFGPVAQSPDGKEMIWVAAKKENRRKTTYILCRQAITDTAALAIRELSSWAAFPSFLPDSISIVFCDNGKIYKRNLETEEEQFLCNGYFPAVSPDGQNVAYVKKGDIYIVSIEDAVSKPIITDRTFKCSPRFSNDGTKVLYWGEQKDKVVLASCDTSGQNPKVLFETQISLWGLRNRQSLYCFDVNPNNDAVVYNNGDELVIYSLTDSSVSSLNLRGRYPRFSADGQKIISILDTRASQGELWEIDKPAYDKLDAFLASEKPNRKEMIKLIEKIAMTQK